MISIKEIHKKDIELCYELDLNTISLWSRKQWDNEFNKKGIKDVDNLDILKSEHPELKQIIVLTSTLTKKKDKEIFFKYTPQNKSKKKHFIKSKEKDNPFNVLKEISFK